MAVPSVPSDVSASGAIESSHMNALLDIADWWMNSRPLFKGQGLQDVGNTRLPTATAVEMGHGSSSGAFETAAVTNVGSFTVASSANGDGFYNLEVPEAGHYEGFWWVEFEANATGHRRVIPQHESGNISGSAIILPAASGLVTRISAPFEVDCAADDELSVTLQHNSGTNLNFVTFLFVKWVQST